MNKEGPHMPCRCPEGRLAQERRQPALHGCRRRVAAGVLPLLLVACVSPLPPIQLLRLPAEAPAATGAVAPRPDPAASRSTAFFRSDHRGSDSSSPPSSSPLAA